MVGSESEFHDALGALIAEATEHGTDVAGAWDVRDADGERSGWTVEITKFANESADPERRERPDGDEV